MGFLVFCGPLDVAKPLEIRSDIPAKTTRFPLLGELHTTIQAWKFFYEKNLSFDDHKIKYAS